jgi:two-component system sensor histidine kinase CpxA
MRSIFVRLLLSFFLTILLTGLISGLVMFSLSRRSVDSFRHTFQRQLQQNIARSVVLMGQAAYVMRQYQGDGAFVRYVDEIDDSMRTQLFLRIGSALLPARPELDGDILDRLQRADLDHQPYIEDDGRQLIVAQRLRSSDGTAYVVIGLHRIGPPPGMDGPGAPPGFNGPRPPPRGLPDKPMPPPRPAAEPERSFLWSLLGRDKEVRLFVFLPVAGIICYLLARTFTAPLAHLRRISRQIAAGDLTARIGTSLGKPGNEIGDLARDFDHMAERMEGLVNGQKRLLLDISHELRSPLARLNLALELAKNRFNAEEDPHLARIGRESERLNALIGQLLSLTRSEGFVINGETPQLPLDALIVEVIGDVDFETRGRGCGVEMRAVAPLVVVGSRELLRQAIENVVRNGAYYTPVNTRVQVELFSACEHGASWAVIRVCDHGPGVPEEKISQLTEPFFRVAEARERNSGGTGLGLAIAQQVVQQHGGSLHFQNNSEGAGLIVDIRLPLVNPPAESSRQNEENASITFS